MQKERTYNNCPLRSGYINYFSRLSLEDLMAIKTDLGLAMSIEQLIAIQKNTVRAEGRITTDELYMADAFLDSLLAFSHDFYFDSLITNKQEIEESFADICAKRSALGFSLPINHASLFDAYNKYLLSLGYAEEKAVLPNFAIKEKTPQGSGMKNLKRTNGPSVGRGDCNYTLSKVSAHYRFNTDKKRIHKTKINGDYHLLLVKLPQDNFAFDSLANTVDSNTAISNDVVYLAPIGEDGLFGALQNTGCGYVINMETVSALMGDMSPFELSRKMNAACLLVPAPVSQSIAITLLNFGYSVRFVGQSNTKNGDISVFYSGIYHTLNGKILKDLLPSLPLVPTVRHEYEGDGFVSSGFPHEKISMTVFCEPSYEDIYNSVSSSVAELKNKATKEKIYAYIALPVQKLSSREAIGYSLVSLLGIYKALAENSIYIADYSVIPLPRKENGVLFLVSESADEQNY